MGTCFGADGAATSHEGSGSSFDLVKNPDANAPPKPDAKSQAPSKADAPSNADDDTHDYDTPHYEPAGFPLLGGDSDIGFEFGVVGTLSHFANGVIPYQWNMDVVLALSLKSGPHGDEITQQSYQWNIDVPQVFGGRVRLNPQLLYYRTVNQLYFGVGNASSPVAPAGASPRYFEFDDRQARFRELTRVTLQGPVDLMFGTIYRFEDPHPYDGSKLASDAAAGAIRGVDPASLFTFAAGIVYDTRDSEIFPRRGSYHHIGLRGTYGLPTSSGIGYGGAGARISTYVPLGGPAILALRGVADLEFGNVPVYDLYTGGVFLTDEMVGGSSSVRGVPDGRYSGLIKVFGNAEVRALLVRFHLFDQEFHLGGNLLFDTGRLWSDYTFHARADGSGIGLKWGAGGGGYLQWGQAAVFRLEVAYSPDAASENPSLPLGIYVEDGVMF
ncbi:MAG TPA: BamA/TamA family outer membrane protein [Polyangiaceae bacterium]|nr:BamA/TamA family outer membrane protein [Polyangiaceae bacterium]